MKISITGLDRKFSRYIRAKAGWACERCGKEYGGPSQGLHCSHFFGRRGKSTRWDVDNCDSLCYGCHQVFSEHRENWTNAKGERVWGYKTWKLNKLGENKYDALIFRGNFPSRPDEALLNLWLDQELKKMEMAA